MNYSFFPLQKNAKLLFKYDLKVLVGPLPQVGVSATS